MCGMNVCPVGCASAFVAILGLPTYSSSSSLWNLDSPSDFPFLAFYLDSKTNVDDVCIVELRSFQIFHCLSITIA